MKAKIKIMNKLAMVAILLSPYTSIAGVKEGGGGHFVFNADGTVTIADAYYNNKTLVPTPLKKSIQDATKEVAANLDAIGLYWDKRYFDTALYYFVDVIPQVADCALSVSLALPSGSTIDLAACTTDDHTFIKTSDWDRAPSDVKVALLIHERLRERTGKNSAAIEGGIMTIIQASRIVESIHASERHNNYPTLTLSETQTLESARLAVSDLKLDKSVFCGKRLMCFADVPHYAISQNGGGLVPRTSANEIPDSSYIGAGSVLWGASSVGENVRLVRSQILLAEITVKNNVQLDHAILQQYLQGSTYDVVVELSAGTIVKNVLLQYGTGGEWHSSVLSGVIDGGSGDQPYHCFINLPNSNNNGSRLVRSSIPKACIQYP